MNHKVQLTALFTHIHHEYARMSRIPVQMFLPTLITTLIYFLVFGAIIGKRIGSIDGVDYSSFITPGLLMLAVITNSYANSSSSLFSARFQKSVEELLISPMRYELFLLGYVLGGIIRGFIVAIAVIAVAMFFIKIDLIRLPLTFIVTILFASLFSLAGFTNGMMAKTFDELSIVPTFILSPLIYLGGVFFSIEMLTPFWHAVALINPVYYMIDLLRFAMIGYSAVNAWLGVTILVFLVVAMSFINLYLLKRGVGIRD